MIKFTRNGVPVQGLAFDSVNKRYTGFVGSKLLSWDKDGRRSTMRTSRYDLVDKPTYYFNVYRWGRKVLVQKEAFTNLNTALQNKPPQYLKTIECQL